MSEEIVKKEPVVMRIEDCLSEGLVMQFLGIGKPALSRLIKAGMPYIRLSKTLRVYRLSDLNAWFDTLKVPQA